MIQKRKKEHVEIVLQKGAQAHYNFWQDINLVHCALPEISRNCLSLRTNFLGRSLSAPFIISAMTGGFAGAEKINSNLAQAAQTLQIGFGVGSQRPALVDPKLIRTYTVVKKYTPALVLANIGAPQLLPQGKEPGLAVDQLTSIMEMVNAHALAVHLNFAQEVHQREGNQDAQGCLQALRETAKHLPVVAKETGGGISREVATQLSSAGVKAIDIGGAGGTSFPAVESFRDQGQGRQQRKARLFWDWGIPAPASLVESRAGVPLIASGGIRSGLDAAKAIALGADLVGIAFPLLEPATVSLKATVEVLDKFLDEFEDALFLTGSSDLASLKKKAVVITGPTAQWLSARGYKLEQWAQRGC